MEIELNIENNKRLILKSVAPYELRASIGPDVMNVLTGQATEEEEKAQIDALHAVQSLDSFDRQQLGLVRLQLLRRAFEL